MNNNKEQKFYSILKDLFVGAKLEGESGYVNLMNIKTDYFNKIRERIEKEVQAKFGKDQPEDLFDKLYTFFDSYFSDGGAIFFSSTPVYKNIYAKVYSDREDTALFWKTAKLYYVKSEANYKSIENLSIDSDSGIAFDFAFDATLLKHKQSNEKKELEFYFIGVQKRGGKRMIKFHVLYKNDNKYTKLQEILKIKDKAKIIKYLVENIEKLENPEIVLSNSGLDFAKLSDSGVRDRAKVEFIVLDNKDLTGSVSIEPAISETGEIEKYLKLEGVNLISQDLEKAFRIYKKQTEIDYFIHKDAKKFLREQFDLYMYQHLAGSMDTVFNQESLDRIKKIKDIAHLTIDFIGNFEDELKKIWLKPKFARRSNYVLTLDRIADKKGGLEVIAKILEFKGFNNQFAEWLELGIVDKKFNPKEIIKNNKLNKDLQFLPIDTKHFKDLEIEIIGLFDNLDEALDGRLIKSDNFQAINTLLPKYKEQVQAIYIDPPFNTDSSPIAYLNNYKDSTWLTMIANRLEISTELLNNTGLNITAIDDVELRYLTILQDSIFHKENYVTTIASECNPQGRVANKVSQTSEYHIIHGKNISYIDKIFVKKMESKDPSPLKRTGTNSRREERPNRYFPILIKSGRIFMITQEEYDKIYNRDEQKFDDKFVATLENKYKKLGFEIVLPLGRSGEKLVWQRTFDRVLQEKGTYITKNGIIYTPSFEIEIPKTLWKHSLFSNPEYGSEYLKHLLGHSEFETPKSFYTIMQLLSMTKGGFCLDYFGGSGTTAQAVIEMNKIDVEKRKYIIMEMGEYFYTVIVPRLKKICFSDKWISGIAQNNNGVPQFFKYYELEQYEDVLKRANYNPTEKELQKIDFDFSALENGAKAERKKQIEDSFSLSEKLADKGLEVDLKKEKAKFVFEKLYPDVDIAETISNLFGKKIKKIGKDKVIFEDDSEVDLNNLDFTKYVPLKKLIYW